MTDRDVKKIANIEARIVSPIHIRCGDESLDYDRMGYALLDDGTFQVIEKGWIESLADGNPDNEDFVKLLKPIKEGKFGEFEKEKSNYDLKDFNIEKIDISEECYDILDNKGNANNEGIVKRTIYNKFTGNPIVPGSTLKGIFRTIFLFGEKSQYEGTDYPDGKYNNIKNDYSFLQFEDIEITECEKMIQMFKNVNVSSKELKGINIPKETIIGGTFDININELYHDKNGKLVFDNLDIEGLIKSYSELIIKREEKVINNVCINKGFISMLRENYNNGNYPIKIGMSKKSLAYKLFWDETIENEYTYLIEFIKKYKSGEYSIDRIDRNKLKKFFYNKDSNKTEKEINKFTRKILNKFNPNDKKKTNITAFVGMNLGLGDYSMYVDEKGIPVGWITLSMK